MKSPDPQVISMIVRRTLSQCYSLYQQAGNAPDSPHELFRSDAVNSVKAEIVGIGRKLWERQYVDGNGGNISARVSSQYVICTPTLCSKSDLNPNELSLVDLENRQILGSRPPTSEILLHLEIYKAVSKARAVIHCHPPYATAHAIAGVVPQGNLLPEQEIFVGPVALTPYETPGTVAFARTVVPFARQHNTILLSNHGIVCWADTVTHAEWYTEVIETYCKTVMIASRLRTPLQEIPPDKIQELLAIKQRWGLPDARLPEDSETESPFSVDMPVTSAGTRLINEENREEMVASLTAQIVKFLEREHEEFC
jgi:L-fuculose-phosphate aldolase